MSKPAQHPLVLVPGLLCTADLYADQRRDLADVATITIGDHTRHPTIEKVAAAILADAPRRFALGGLSMGGYVALEMTRQAPDRVERLALLDTSARPDAPERAASRRKLIELARKEGLAAAQRELMPLLIHPSREHEAPLVARVLRMAEDTGLDAFINQQEALIARPDARGLLSQIRCPTLVVVGDGDALTPPELARELNAGIPGSTLTVIPACGHLSTMERPQEATAALRRWLTSMH